MYNFGPAPFKKEPDPHIDAEDALSSLGMIFFVLIPLLKTVFPTSLSANL